jgi:hypothetical protein
MNNKMYSDYVKNLNQCKSYLSTKHGLDLGFIDNLDTFIKNATKKSVVVTDQLLLSMGEKINECNTQYIIVLKENVNDTSRFKRKDFQFKETFEKFPSKTGKDR